MLDQLQDYLFYGLPVVVVLAWGGKWLWDSGLLKSAGRPQPTNPEPHTCRRTEMFNSLIEWQSCINEIEDEAERAKYQAAIEVLKPVPYEIH